MPGVKEPEKAHDHQNPPMRIIFPVPYQRCLGIWNEVSTVSAWISPWHSPQVGCSLSAGHLGVGVPLLLGS